MLTASKKYSSSEFLIRTWFDSDSKRVLSCQFVEGNVSEESSVVRCNLHTALQSDSIGFGTVLLVQLSCFREYGLLCNLVNNL